MNIDNEISVPLTELLSSQNQEIAKYKWFESQRLGHDIGWTKASEEWFEKHFADWVREQRRLIDEALSMSEPLQSSTRVRRAQELQAV